MALFTASRGNTFVGGTCALPSAFLVIMSFTYREKLLGIKLGLEARRFLSCDIDIAILSARDVPRIDENSLTYCHSFFTIRWHNHSSFISIKHLQKIPMGSPPAGAINTGGV